MIRPTPRSDVARANEARGYQPIHTSGCRCPGCHQSQWFIGRQTAECAACGVALPMAAEVRHG